MQAVIKRFVINLLKGIVGNLLAWVAVAGGTPLPNQDHYAVLIFGAIITLVHAGLSALQQALENQKTNGQS